MLSTTDMHVTLQGMQTVAKYGNGTPEDRDMLCNDDNMINCDDCSLRITFTKYVTIVCDNFKL